MNILTFPNLLTVLRLALVPLVAYLLAAHNFEAAFICFIIAGLTDFIDGQLARHLNQKSPFGAWLDPAADKALIVIIFTLLAALGAVPLWLLLLVALRDIAIVAAIADLYIAGKPPAFEPLRISKLNTLVQILYLALVLLNLAYPADLGTLVQIAGLITGTLTALSFLAYFRLWLSYRRDKAEQGQGNMSL
jgi:cardiolipin synthase